MKRNPKGGPVPGGDSFPALLLAQAERRPQAPAMREKRYGIWQTLSWREMSELVRDLACGLAEAGLARGEHVVLVGENRPRLYAAMLAVQSLGAVPVPLYQDAVAAEFVFPIENAEVAFAVVEDQEQVDKLLEIRARTPRLARIWYDEPRGLRNYAEPGLESLQALIDAGRSRHARDPGFFLEQVGRIRSDDVAAIFFTSGTTAEPKGVVHTHASLIDRARAGARFDSLDEREEVLAYLPPAWIGQNCFSYAQWLVCGYVVNCPESASTVTIDLKEVGPTYYFAPPRVFEALLTDVTIRMEDASLPKRWMFERFMRIARRRVDATALARPSLLERLLLAIGDVLVYGPLRNALGMSRIRVAYTAGEAIGPDLFAFYRSIGINLKQLYGSTETAVFVCVQPDHDVRPETVGVALEGVQLRIDDRGEILIKSAGLLKEYYKNPQASAEVLTPDGWYRSGDAGFLDASGQLRVIDRAKDVGRLRGGPWDGAMFAPKYVENKLKFFPHIKEAVAFGDGRDKVCAFVNIDFEAMGNWAEKRNLSYTGYTDLAGKPEVQAFVLQCVEKVNADLAADPQLAGSQISRFLVLHKELDADDGELTRTRKVRRGFIAQKYALLVEAMYEGRDAQYVETQVRFEDGRTGTTAANVRILDARTFPALRKAA
ncbi:MAG: long-chain fatty acid--CoA ligase [Burkholderiales bacterium]|nr:MAG: long-chain fatty acid--CoA ligase [Burkholderiales bacterium]